MTNDELLPLRALLVEFQRWENMLVDTLVIREKEIKELKDKVVALETEQLQLQNTITTNEVMLQTKTDIINSLQEKISELENGSFKKGDIVRLKGGCIKMRIIGVHDDGTCTLEIKLDGKTVAIDLSIDLIELVQPR